MTHIKFFVEGKWEDTARGQRLAHSSDARFIRDYVKTIFGVTLSIENNFELIGGTSNLFSKAQFMRMEIESRKNKVVVIVDADSNVAERKRAIQEFKEAQDLPFSFFLFPNDKDIGEIETLLEYIATNENLLNCFTDYEKCIGQALDIKDKIYSYILAFTGDKKAAQDRNRDFTNGAFNLDHEALIPLKEFLAPFFS